ALRPSLRQSMGGTNGVTSEGSSEAPLEPKPRAAGHRRFAGQVTHRRGMETLSTGSAGSPSEASRRPPALEADCVAETEGVQSDRHLIRHERLWHRRG